MTAVGRILAAVTGALGLIGLGLSMLPLVTVTTSDTGIGMGGALGYLYGFGAADLSRFCELFPEDCASRGTVTVSLGFLDVPAWGVPMVALIPIALGVVAATGILQAVRGVHPGGPATTALLSLGALLVTLFTWARPVSALSGTGDFRRLVTTGSSGVNTGTSVSPGAGLICAGVALLLIVAVSTYQALAALLVREAPSGPVPVPAY